MCIVKCANIIKNITNHYSIPLNSPVYTRYSSIYDFSSITFWGSSPVNSNANIAMCQQVVCPFVLKNTWPGYPGSLAPRINPFISTPQPKNQPHLNLQRICRVIVIDVLRDGWLNRKEMRCRCRRCCRFFCIVPSSYSSPPIISIVIIWRPFIWRTPGQQKKGNLSEYKWNGHLKKKHLHPKPTDFGGGKLTQASWVFL